MRVGIRSGLASGKIRAILQGVVLIALVIPSVGVVLAQQGAGAGAQVPLFTAIDLNPRGFDESHASGISGGEQVGYGSGLSTGGHTHALLWHGSAASVVDLHPGSSSSESNNSVAVVTCGGQQVGYAGESFATGPLLWRGSADSVVYLLPGGYSFPRAFGISGGQQVGYGREEATSGNSAHALLWRGSANNVVDLHPSDGKIWESYALGTSGEEQVGYGYYGRDEEGETHALLWRGTAASAVDLHPSGFSSSKALGVSGGQQVGYGFGPATGGQTHALLWRGTSANVVDLHPGGFFFSRALGTNGDEQVGWGDKHALLWRGTAASVVDLHTFLPPGFVISVASDIDTTGDVVGTAWGPASGSRYHAFLWKRNVPKSASRDRKDNARCGGP